MTAKEYLRQYKRARIEVMRIKRQLEEVNDLIGNVTVDPTNEHVQTTREPDQIGDLVARRSDILADLLDAKARALDIMQDICATINKIQDPDYQLILQARYIECESWKSITKSMHYSDKYIFRLHKKALIEIEKIIKRIPKDTFDL